jgi:hypothetical protein
MLKKADELEEQLIKTEVLPTLSKDIEPRLSQIQRELVLVVEYKPGEPISVALSRKTNIAELLEAKRLEPDPQVEHMEFGPRTTKQEKKAPGTEICVYRKDGSILQEHNAATTFVAAIVEAGPLRVRQLGIKYCRINIVSTTKDQKYGHAQREIERGLYVLTHSNTKDKKKMLDRISNALHLGWTVEIIDK